MVSLNINKSYRNKSGSYYSLQIQIFWFYCTDSRRQTAKVSFLPLTVNVKLEPLYCTKHLSKFDWVSLWCKRYLFSLLFYNSVMSGCMTSHWQQAMKMLRQAQVNCPLKTWKNFAANREELKRKLKRVRKVKRKIESFRKSRVIVTCNSLCQYFSVKLLCFVYFSLQQLVMWKKQKTERRKRIR